MTTFPPLPDWVKLEHQVAHILQQQEEHGWYFDERAAYELESTPVSYTHLTLPTKA